MSEEDRPHLLSTHPPRLANSCRDLAAMLRLDHAASVGEAVWYFFAQPGEGLFCGVSSFIEGGAMWRLTRLSQHDPPDMLTTCTVPPPRAGCYQ